MDVIYNSVSIMRLFNKYYITTKEECNVAIVSISNEIHPSELRKTMLTTLCTARILPVRRAEVDLSVFVHCAFPGKYIVCCVDSSFICTMCA